MSANRLCWHVKINHELFCIQTFYLLVIEISFKNLYTGVYRPTVFSMSIAPQYHIRCVAERLVSHTSHSAHAIVMLTFHVTMHMINTHDLIYIRIAAAQGYIDSTVCYGQEHSL